MTIQRVPFLLFKYLPPERLDVLTNGWMRVSQRQVVNDFEREFHPRYLKAAPADFLLRHLQPDDEWWSDKPIPPEKRDDFVQFLIAQHGDKILDAMRREVKSPDALGMVCLTDNRFSERMWLEYAADSTGFIIGINSNYFFGMRLRVRPVQYSDRPMEYLSEGYTSLDNFFRKNTDLSWEQEWRGIGLLQKFAVMRVINGWPLHACRLPVGSVAAVITRKKCAVRNEIAHLLAIDHRYRDTILVEA